MMIMMLMMIALLNYSIDHTTIIIAVKIIHHCAVAQLIITVTIINTGDRVKQSLNIT